MEEDEVQTWQLQAHLANWSLVSLKFEWNLIMFKLRKFVNLKFTCLERRKCAQVWQVPDTFGEP